jgi:hypothetical protein
MVKVPFRPGTQGPPNSQLGSPSQFQIQNESRHAVDARINMDEYAYNKIFVGGLHYDTRDGKNMYIYMYMYMCIYMFVYIYTYIYRINTDEYAYNKIFVGGGYIMILEMVRRYIFIHK